MYREFNFDAVNTVSADAVRIVVGGNVRIEAVRGGSIIEAMTLVPGRDFTFAKGEGLILRSDVRSGSGIGHGIPGYGVDRFQKILTLTDRGDLAVLYRTRSYEAIGYIIPSTGTTENETVYRRIR